MSATLPNQAKGACSEACGAELVYLERFYSEVPTGRWFWGHCSALLHAAALASKGRLILCTVPTLRPNCSAILRTPSRLGFASAALGQYYERRLPEFGITFERQRLREIVATYFPDLRTVANKLEAEFRF